MPAMRKPRGVPAPAAARAQAHANIALVKYWGKRDRVRNLPSVGSISITLDGLTTTTSVHFDPSLDEDRCRIDGRSDDGQRARVIACLDLLRHEAGCDWRARVDSHNDFPTGAGLASSASGFAALVTAGEAALGLSLGASQRSVIARQCSGSAARSVFGGYVEWHRGQDDDGSDSFAECLLPAAEWPLRTLVAITDDGPKTVGSTDGMQRSDATSPFAAAWQTAQPADLAQARRAIAARDFEALTDVAEHSCLKMHATAMAARPGLIYWNGATVEAMQVVRRLRAAGSEVFFTVDAGPQLKAITTPEHASAVRDALQAVAGVQRVIECGLGDGAQVLACGEAALEDTTGDATA